jgi:dihydroflavonol-4-reductase
MADTVLVTGASGFIATHCILALLDKGYAVRGTVRDLTRAAALKASLAKHNPKAAGISLVRAELTSDEGWADAARGCAYVLHVASPNPLKYPRDKNAFVAPAREGALRVLRAAKAAGVARIVLTSSIVAIAYGRNRPQDRVLTEADWTDPDGADNTAYTRSKTLAERAAWDFVNGPEGKGLELATINPALVLGPVLEQDYGTSAELVYQLLKGKVPGYPRLGFVIVDARDVAALHLAAMTAPAAKGERFIAATEFLWMEEIGKILREAYPERRLPTSRVPDFVVRLMALVNPPVRLILPELGRKRELSHDKATRLLGWQPRPARESILATAQSMIALGII